MTRKLEVGSGFRPHDEYEHLDINPQCPHLEYVAPMDEIPVEDSTFDRLKSVHCIEHYPWKDVLKLLKEWVRVVKPGGTIYIATPNLKFILESYLLALKNNPWNLLNDYKIMLPEEQQRLLINGLPNYALWANFKLFSSGEAWDQHYACYDSITLVELLKEAGCSSVEVLHDGDSLVVEATR